jgi:predicted 3-demethylubiquinone-9 3-methyltransferase (glyoxalase superfamily)
MQKITTFLSFKDQAEDAVLLYTSIFKNSKILNRSYYDEDTAAQVAATATGRMPKGKLLVAVFELEGQTFMAMNGGPPFSFSMRISLLVNCDTQAEVDELWEKLSAGGHKSQCGWLQDRFGVSWQIVPRVLGEMMSDTNREKSSRVMKAMMKMQKIDLQALKDAYEGR